MAKKKSTLKRAINVMPKSVKDLLAEHELMDEYNARPPYQRNDYLGWISRAKRAETQEKRLNQMIEELAAGDRYMKMKYNRPSD